MTKEKKQQQPTIKSADDLIVKSEQDKLGKIVPESKTPQESQSELIKQTPEVKLESNSKELEVSEDKEEQKEKLESQPEEEQQSEPEEDKASNDVSNDDEEIDEYGTKVGKKKLYTEEEVQRMIRDRLKRGQHPEQQQEVAAAA